MTHLDLTNDEKRSPGYRPSPHHRRSPYPLSPRFLTLKAILAKLKPEPVRQALPLPTPVIVPWDAIPARQRRRTR
jgi:hypothetical protein